MQVEFKGQSLKVHVNPNGGHCDEWEIPIGNKLYQLVRSPLECPAENKRAKGDTAAIGEKEKESEERVGPAKNASSVSSAGCEEKKKRGRRHPTSKKAENEFADTGHCVCPKKGPASCQGQEREMVDMQGGISLEVESPHGYD